MRWPILLALLAATPMPAVAANAPTGSSNEEVVCKRQLETGTLAKFTKTCMTRLEWQRLREKSQATGQNLRDRNFSSCSNGPTPVSRSAEMGPTC